MVLSWLSEQLGLGTNEVPADGTDHGGHGSGTADETAAKRVRTEGLVEPQVPVHPNLDESLTSAVRRVARLQVPVDHHGLRLRYARTQTAPPLLPERCIRAAAGVLLLWPRRPPLTHAVYVGFWSRNTGSLECGRRTGVCPPCVQR